jgi:hypothetical protein
MDLSKNLTSTVLLRIAALESTNARIMGSLPGLVDDKRSAKVEVDAKLPSPRSEAQRRS